MASRKITLCLTLTWMLIVNTVTGLWLPHLIDENSGHVQPQVTEHDAGDRQRRSSRSLPSGVDVTLLVEGRNVVLTLRRIADSSASLPIHTLSNGTLVGADLNADIEEFSYYEDEKRDALILIQGSSKDSYSLFGTFKSGLDRYLIQQSTNILSENGETGLHAVSRIPDKMISYSDDVIYPETLVYKKHTEKRAVRSKRQTQEYYIELYMVIDYSLYAFWLNRATGSSFQRDQEAKQNIRQFYSYVLYGIDQRYRGITDQTYTVRVVSPGLLILDKPSDSPMTENNKVSSSPRDIISGSTLLNEFRDWENRQSDLPQRDHTMLFTNYDIVNGSSNGGDIAGLAFLGSLCGNWAHSVIEDKVSPFTMTAAAHELGHNLGADHDGTGNRCSSSSNYIMASDSSADLDLIQNMWIFSSCSVADFTTYINRLNRDGTNCMTATSSGSAFPSINQPMAGVYSADDICSLTKGEGSYVCRSIQDYSTLCASMFCKAPGTSPCYSVMPPEGTSCGSGKICQKGRCISSPNAPTVPDNCPLGDQPGILSYYSQTCADYVADNSYKCYPTISSISSWTGKTCCRSCAARYTGVQGCEYGDQAPWCKTIDRNQCYLNADTCCSYCNSPGVKDTTRPGCEYGDHFSNCDKSLCELYNTASKEGCCETCGTHISDSSVIGIDVGVGLVVVIIVIIIIFFICYKRKHKYIRKHSKSDNNAYDNIGFVEPYTSPPTTSEGQQCNIPSPAAPLPGTLDRGPLRPPSLHLLASGSTGDNNPNEIDGYMTPNGVKVKTVSNGVHYTAPDKPKFNFNVLNGAANKPNNSLTQRNESPRPPRKPKHYRRSSASNSSNVIDSSGTGSHFNSPHSNNPDFAENNNHMNVAQDHTELEGDAYNEISEVINKFNLKPDANEFISNRVHKPKPKPPTMPKPRLPTNETRSDGDSSEPKSHLKSPLKPVYYKLRPDIHDTNAQGYSVGTGSHFNSPHSNNPDFAENNNHMNVAQDHTELEGDAYNEISEVINKFNLKPDANEFISNRVHKPKPKPPTMPKPRLPTNETRSDGDSSEPKSHLKSPLKPVYYKLRPDIHDTNAQGYSELEPHLMPKLKPVNDKFLEKDVASSATLTDSRPKEPLKPKPNNAELKSKLDKLLSVESRAGDGSETTDDNMDSKSPDKGDNDNHVVDKSKALRPPTRPLMRPVPRRQKAERNAHDNPSFEEDTVVNI